MITITIEDEDNDTMETIDVVVTEGTSPHFARLLAQRLTMHVQEMSEVEDTTLCH